MSFRVAARTFIKYRTHCSPNICSRRWSGSSSAEIVKGSVTIDGKLIKYVRVGEGEHVVLCCPGALGSSLTDFKPQIQGLDQSAFTVIAWDPPGYGHSRPPNRDFSPGFLERDADYAIDFMKALGRPKFSVLGWSDGGITGIFLAAKYPENVRKMAIWGANAYITDEEALIYDNIRDVSTWSDRMKAPMVDLYGDEGFRNLWNEWVDAMVRIYREEGGDICKKEVKAVRCPLFVLHGEKDPMVLNEHPHYIVGNAPNAQLHSFKDGKHNIHLRYAEEFNSLVHKFLTSEQSSGTGDHRFPVRLLPFRAENPALWFAQIEAQFHLSNIHDDLTKFNCVLSQLGQKHAAKVQDVICNPPGDGKYNLLKTELLNRHKDDQLKPALSRAKIGHKKPSEFLRLLRELGANSAPESLIRSVWLEGLPGKVQAVVSSLALSLDSLAEVADKVAEGQLSGDLASVEKRLLTISKQLSFLIRAAEKSAQKPLPPTQRAVPRRAGWRTKETVYADATAPKYDVTGLPVPGTVSRKDLLGDVRATTNYHSLLHQYPAILYPAAVPQEVHRRVRHRIVTKGKEPVLNAATPAEMDDIKTAVLRDIMDAMLRQGTARVSNSPHGSTLMLVREELCPGLGPAPGWRAFADYRQLNADTVCDVIRTRHLVEVSDHLWGCNVFSVVNLRKDWTRIPMSREDVAKTAVVTPFGKFEFPFMPQGLLNSERTWLKVLDEVLQGLPYCFGYLDSILVFSRNQDEHLQHIRALFQRLSTNGMFVNASTSVFGEPRVTFFNYSVSSSGCTLIPERTVKAIENMSRPKTYGDVTKFLRVCSAYRRYIPVSVDSPFKAVLEGHEEPYNFRIPWTPELDKAFKDCKSSLSRAALYTQPDTFSPLSISVSVSDHSVGAVLNQKTSVPLAFLSEPLPPKNLNAYFGTTFAIFLAIKAFQPLIGGRDFTVLTDFRFTGDSFFADGRFTEAEDSYLASYCSQFTTDVESVRRSSNALPRCLAFFVGDSAEVHANSDESSEEGAALNMSSRFV